MIKPVKRNLEIYKGVDFILPLRFKSNGAYVDMTGAIVLFNASANGVNVFSLSSAGSPTTISIDPDDNFLTTISIQDTASITETELIYTIDVQDAGGVLSRWMVGQISIYQGSE